ncbi:MAG: hypothetical protein QOE45_2799 [Frankiaceae bacterium]|jgi:hypothetical protein|nr:hypothetical protein [Frankiaceae bacterium]
MWRGDPYLTTQSHRRGPGRLDRLAQAAADHIGRATSRLAEHLAGPDNVLAHGHVVNGRCWWT